MMPARRAHKKSRNGCNQCKLRRVKCDESGPPCANCQVREISCDYSAPIKVIRRVTPSSIDRKSASLPSGGSRSPPVEDTLDGGHSPSLASVVGNRVLELELIHLWSTRTWLTFCHQHGQDERRRKQERKLLRDFLPRQGFRFEFALHALLAVAALHMATLPDTTEPQKYVKAALEYQHLSHSSFNEAFENVNEDNCHAVLSCALLYFILGLAGPQIFGADGNTKSVKESIISVIRLYRGVIKIMLLLPQNFSQGPFATFFSSLAPKDMSAYAESDDNVRTAFDRMRVIAKNGRSPRGFERDLDLIDRLEAASRRVRSGVPAAVFGWLETLPEALITDLESSETMATLLLMHWAVLLDVPTDLWWTLKSGRSLIDELCTSVSGTTDDQRAAIDWCRLQVRLPLTIQLRQHWI